MSINIHQIYFLKDQLNSLEKSFIPYDNSTGDRDWYEYGVFKKEYEDHPIEIDEFRGYVSWKFTSKTNISGTEFIEFIKKNPGYDVYFINPFYDETFFFKNVWECGEYHHPGLIVLVQDLLDRLEYNIDLKSLVQDENTTSYCNFWAGNRNFWDRYMSFTLPVYNALTNNTYPDLTEKIYGIAKYHMSASHIPFIMERMFSTMLVNSEYRDLKSKAYSYSDDQLSKKYKIEIPLLGPLQDLKARELSGKPSENDPDWRNAAREVRKIYQQQSPWKDLYNKKLAFSRISPVVNGEAQWDTFIQSGPFPLDVEEFCQSFSLDLTDTSTDTKESEFVWIPANGLHIKIILDKCEYRHNGQWHKLDVGNFRHNGIKDGDWIDFWRLNPRVTDIKIQSPASEIRFWGKWQLVPAWVIGNKVHALMNKV